jgi:hypothetical protein
MVSRAANARATFEVWSAPEGEQPDTVPWSLYGGEISQDHFCNEAPEPMLLLRQIDLQRDANVRDHFGGHLNP